MRARTRGEEMRIGSCASTNIEWGTLRQMAAVEPEARRRAMLMGRVVVVVVVVGSEDIARTFEKAEHPICRNSLAENHLIR